MKSMKQLQFLLAILFGTFSQNSLSAQEDPDKIGTVDMQKLVRGYYKSKQVEKSFKGYSEELAEQNNKRVETINELVQSVRDLGKEIENPTLPKDKQEELLQKAISQQGEIRALKQALEDWGRRKQAALAEKQKIDFGELRVEIMEMVREVGEETGYDFIFDRSAASGANVLILAYAKDATDLTAVMIKRINRDAPDPSEQEKPDEGAPAPE